MYQLSIIIPIYQAERTIANAIDSILCASQNSNAIEVLLIDDGSTDNSMKICKEYEQEYNFVRLFSQENKGVSAARNVGLENATGKYVIFLDCDDEFSGNSLYDILSLLKRGQEIQLLVFGFKYIYSDKVIEKIMDIESGFYGIDVIMSSFYEWYYTYIFHNIGTKVYCRRILEQRKIRFSESKSYLEDITFFIDYLQYVEKFYYIDKAFYNYYRMEESNSLSSGYRNNYFVCFKYMLKSMKILLCIKNQNEKVYGKIVLSELVNIFVHGITYKREDMLPFNEILLDGEYLDLYKKYSREFNLKYRLILRIIFMRIKVLQKGIIKLLIYGYGR